MIKCHRRPNEAQSSPSDLRPQTAWLRENPRSHCPTAGHFLLSEKYPSISGTHPPQISCIMRHTDQNAQLSLLH